MKFSVSQSALASALLVVAKGMATNSTLPILSGIYVRATEGTLEFQTTNLTISIRHKIAANVEEPGETVVSGKILSNIVKTLPDAVVNVDGADRQVSIRCDKSSFRLNALDPSDFPEFPSYELSRSIELPTEILSDMCDRVYKVTSRDAARPILSGVLLSVEGEVLRLVATDSYRLAVCDTQVAGVGAEEPFTALVAGATLHDALNLPSMGDAVLVGTTDSQVVFSSGNTTYVSRKIEGNFPNYRQLLPTSCQTTLTLDVATFTAALKRVSVVALANPSVRLDIDADGSLLRLSASSPDQGESNEIIDAEVTGDSMPIALNYHYMFDCVNAMGNRAKMTIELQSSMQPAIFRSSADINYVYLLMPVRM